MRLQRSPMTATVRAREHGSSSSASHFIRSVSAVQPQEDRSDALHLILKRHEPLNNKK
jgi:hypothetical protein